MRMRAVRARTKTAMPAPMPAFAPMERPFGLGGCWDVALLLLVASVDGEVGVAVVDAAAKLVDGDAFPLALIKTTDVG